MPVITIRISATATDKNGETRELRPDEALAVRGPVLEATLTVSDAHQRALVSLGKSAKSKVGLVMFDTGASLSCFDQKASEEIGLAIVGKGSMSSASHANQTVPVYAGKLILPGLNINIEKGMGAKLAPQGLIALIGRDIMSLGTLFYNGHDGSISFSI